MSVLSDGSQARKTQEDKELLLVRTVRNGFPIYLLLDLLNMSEYGGTDALSIKTAIDGTFDEESGSVKLSADDYRRKMISATADGASVNMGAYQGVLTRLSTTRDWLLPIHCVNHCIELAAKKVVTDSVYKSVEEFYLSLYFFMRNSGRFKSECKHSAESLDIDFKELPKIHGTRFLGHKRTGITNFLADWPVFLTTCENAAAMTGARAYQAATKSKIIGFVKKIPRLPAVTAYSYLLRSFGESYPYLQGIRVRKCYAV